MESVESLTGAPHCSVWVPTDKLPHKRADLRGEGPCTVRNGAAEACVHFEDGSGSATRPCLDAEATKAVVASGIYEMRKSVRRERAVGALSNDPFCPASRSAVANEELSCELELNAPHAADDAKHGGKVHSPLYSPSDCLPM